MAHAIFPTGEQGHPSQSSPLQQQGLTHKYVSSEPYPSSGHSNTHKQQRGWQGVKGFSPLKALHASPSSSCPWEEASRPSCHESPAPSLGKHCKHSLVWPVAGQVTICWGKATTLGLGQLSVHTAQTTSFGMGQAKTFVGRMRNRHSLSP